MSTPRNPNHRRSAARGFTLIEILVVIGIIALITAIAVPAIMASYKKARNIKTAADLQAISTALEAYHTDFGDYPRVGALSSGFAVLGQTLISPGPSGGPLPTLGASPYRAGRVASTGVPGSGSYAEFVCFGKPDPSGEGFSTTATQSDVTTWAPFAVSDGKDGPGFKARMGGKAYGPYLQPDKFKLEGMAILDGWGNPILYFPARPGKIAQDTTGPGWPLISGGAGSVYNPADNVSFFLRGTEAVNVPADATKALKRMDAICVRTSANFDGVINAGESAATTGSYMLWSAGANGTFGATYDTATAGPTKQEITKCDDVTNFER